MAHESFWPTWKSNRVFTLVLVILGAYLIVLLASMIQMNFGKTARLGKADTQPYTISIAGTGKITATPNIASATLGLQTTKSDVLSAQKENTDTMNLLIGDLKKMDIAASDIQTADYSVYPQYSYDQKTGKSTIDGYIVSQNVRVKIRDLSKISLVLGKAGERGLNQVSGVDFTIDEPASLETQARVMALADASQKAVDLARALGVKLVRVVGFSESSSPVVPPIMYAPMAARDMSMGGGAAPAVESGSLDVTSNVVITYEIE